MSPIVRMPQTLTVAPMVVTPQARGHELMRVGGPAAARAVFAAMSASATRFASVAA